MGILKGKKWRLVFSFSWPCHVSSSFWSNASKLPFESVSCQLTKETGRRLSSWDPETRGGPFVQFPNSPKFKRRGCSRIQISGPQEATMPPNLLKCCFAPRKSFQKYLGSHPVPIYFFSQYNCRSIGNYRLTCNLLVWANFDLDILLFWCLHILMFCGLGFNPFRSGGCLGIGLTPWNGKSNWMNTNSCLKSICVLSPISLTEDISYSSSQEYGWNSRNTVCNNMYRTFAKKYLMEWKLSSKNR